MEVRVPPCRFGSRSGDCQQATAKSFGHLKLVCCGLPEDVGQSPKHRPCTRVVLVLPYLFTFAYTVTQLTMFSPILSGRLYHVRKWRITPFLGVFFFLFGQTWFSSVIYLKIYRD